MILRPKFLFYKICQMKIRWNYLYWRFFQIYKLSRIPRKYKSTLFYLNLRPFKSIVERLPRKLTMRSCHAFKLLSKYTNQVVVYPYVTSAIKNKKVIRTKYVTCYISFSVREFDLFNLIYEF